MRPVLFQFYTVEILLNMILMFCHIHGFLRQSLDFLPLWSLICHYFSSAAFYIFTVLTIFASINICTGHQFSIVEEIVRTMVGFLLYIFISLMILENAERDFYLFNAKGESRLEVEKPLHPVFQYMRVQALCALVCGVIYLLHGVIVIDVLMSTEQRPDEDDSDYDGDYDGNIPVRLYVLGEVVQSRLQRYEWFNDFDLGENMDI
ncbi:uncharacterized protein LOC135438177 [Drosophila montana]|uniref:uncharacterized protein LOC135438177 n=1 Tax=Drosophila montana TaxID=40370 RepID=UPI00313E2EA7